MTTTAESNGSCSTVVAPLDEVDEALEDDVATLVALPEVLVELAVELVTGSCVSRINIGEEARKDETDHSNMSRSGMPGPRSGLEMNNFSGR
jgi:hypothetical protein